MADFAAKELKLKNVVTITEDFAFGYEQMGGFQQTFEENGGKIINKIWPPLVTPDYTPFVAQIADCDGVCQGFAGSNPLRFMKTYAAAGLKFPVVTGETGGDDALMRSFGDEALGMYSCCPYTLDLATDSNKRFVAGDAEGLQGRSRASMPPGSMSPPRWLPPVWKKPTANPTTRKPSSRRYARSI